MNNGIYTDLSIEDYHANTTHISATQIKYARQSIKHFHYYVNGKIPREEKSHFHFGNAFELALLSPQEYLNKVAVLPDNELVTEILSDGKTKNARNTNRYKEGVSDFMTKNTGKYLINDCGPESFETIEEMLSSCFQDKIIQGLIKNTEYQLSLFWTDPDTGIQLKTRPDFCKRKKNIIVNLKTTLDGSPEAFSKDLKKYDYPIQAARRSIIFCLTSLNSPFADVNQKSKDSFIPLKNSLSRNDMSILYSKKRALHNPDSPASLPVCIHL